MTNMRSIIERGILSHRRAATVEHTSVAMESVQAVRARKKIPGGRYLHEYANAYFWCRNTMMYALHELHKDLCILRIGPGILDLPGVVVSDRNAANGLARFDPPGVALPRLDYARITAQFWNHDYATEKARHKAEMCAEVLVPDRIAPGQIVGAYVSCSDSERVLLQMAPSLTVSVNFYLFFR
jgi:hypothetical protein